MAVWNMWLEYNLFVNTEWWGRAESIEGIIVNKEGSRILYSTSMVLCKGHFFLVNFVYLNRYKYKEKSCFMKYYVI